MLARNQTESSIPGTSTDRQVPQLFRGGAKKSKHPNVRERVKSPATLLSRGQRLHGSRTFHAPSEVGVVSLFRDAVRYSSADDYQRQWSSSQFLSHDVLERGFGFANSRPQASQSDPHAL